MVRTRQTSAATKSGFPHARGDGPSVDTVTYDVGGFSPRPWGWSARSRGESEGEEVFPTPVGMVRPAAWWTWTTLRFPHARGDGPVSMYCASTFTGFSPRPWGWSASLRRWKPTRRVFPTPVGMVRPARRWSPSCACFPHARGDGPYLRKSLITALMFSPRPWGWSATINFEVERTLVFPTPVGMVRISRIKPSPKRSFPHARGDGPRRAAPDDALRRFSPRPWGWSAGLQALPAPAGVFPTPVGMVRGAARLILTAHSFPHARGDGPMASAISTRSHSFSPRPWGWSGLHPAGA